MVTDGNEGQALDRAEHDLAEAQSELRKAEGDLAKADSELGEAKGELADAEQDIRKAEEAIKKAEDEREFRVEVFYNGVGETFEVHREELVKTLLEKAINKFGPIPQPHTMALYNEHGNELPDVVTLKAAGVKPRDELLLRPSQVKGGGS